MSTEAARELRIKVLGAIAGLLIICATVAGCVMDADRIEKLAHFLTDPATAVAFSALGGTVLALYLRAKASPAAAILLALLAAGSLQGCTPSQWSDAMHVIKPVGKFACDTATMLCEKGGDPTACAAIAVVCEGVSLITSGGFEEGTGPADAQGAEHTIDGVDP